MAIFPDHFPLNNSAPRFFRNDSILVRKLSGFQNHHHVPTNSDNRSSQFIGSLVLPELKQEFQNLHRLLREIHGLKRRDIEVTLEQDGAAILESNLLRLEKRFLITPDFPAKVTCKTILDQVSDLNMLTDQRFEKHFPYRFDALEIPFEFEIDIPKLIDFLEEDSGSQPALDLEYDFQATTCNVNIHQLNSSITFSKNLVSFSSKRLRTSSQLLQDYNENLKILNDFF